jgi:hypothetical protein
VRVSHLAMHLEGHLAELDINPLMVLPSGQGVKAVDAPRRVSQHIALHVAQSLTQKFAGPNCRRQLLFMPQFRHCQGEPRYALFGTVRVCHIPTTSPFVVDGPVLWLALDAPGDAATA